MSEITVFAFDSSAVRSLMIEGEPWFVATDLAAILGYRSAPDMVRNLDDDERGTHIVRTPSSNQHGDCWTQETEVSIINESGLYSAILKSRKPEAKRFKKWVTAEVLPCIRKTGSYHAPGAAPQATLSHNPSHAADQFVAADRSFRAALRSARAAGLRTPRALALARGVALAKTGLDMFSELSITAEDLEQASEPGASVQADPESEAVAAWFAQCALWRWYKLAEIVREVFGVSEGHPGYHRAVLKVSSLLEALGMKKGQKRDENGVKQRWWWRET